MWGSLRLAPIMHALSTIQLHAQTPSHRPACRSWNLHRGLIKLSFYRQKTFDIFRLQKHQQQNTNDNTKESPSSLTCLRYVYMNDDRLSPHGVKNMLWRGWHPDYLRANLQDDLIDKVTWSASWCRMCTCSTYFCGLAQKQKFVPAKHWLSDIILNIRQLDIVDLYHNHAQIACAIVLWAKIADTYKLTQQLVVNFLAIRY